MCIIIELNSKMTECAKKSKLLPEEFFGGVGRQLVMDSRKCVVSHITLTLVHEVHSLCKRLPKRIKIIPNCLATKYRLNRFLKKKKKIERLEFWGFF